MRTCTLMCWLLVIGAASADEFKPRFEWAISAGGTQHDKTRCIAVDPQGNVLLTGEFTGTTTFGEQTLTAVGGMDVFIAKVDSTGKFLWVKQGGGTLTDRGYGVACDPAGNVYVTGHFESKSATFEQQTVKSGGNYDLFVAKYDPTGTLQWIQAGGGAGYDYGHAIAVSRTGIVYVTGAIAGVGTFADQPIGADGPHHLFCLALDAAGAVRWQVSAEGKGSGNGHGIGVDNQGNCYVGGSASGDQSLAGTALTTPTGHDILIAKFSPAGQLVWLHQGHGSAHAMIHELTADPAGNVWASGMFQGDLKLADRTVANQGKHDLFLTQLDSTGQRRWTFTAGGSAIDYGLGVTTDGQGNSYLSGSFAGAVDFAGRPQASDGPAADIYVCKFDRAGQMQWFVQAGSKNTDHAYTIVHDGRGALYLSGACSGPATFGSHAIPHRGSNDLFLAKLRVTP